MPRLPKTIHPLRMLRLATDHPTQSDFAAYVGVSSATIQAVEQGKLKLTPQLAARIRQMTGCNDAELLKGWAGKAKGLDGKVYCMEHFQSWKGQLGKSLGVGDERSAATTATADVEEMFRLIMLAARRHGGPGGVQAARTMAVESVERIRQKLRLDESLEQLLLPLQHTNVLSGTAAEWKRVPKGHMREVVGELTLPKSLKRLTIAWQASPPWAGGLPLKEKTATNIELFPPSYAIVSVGGAGCRIGMEFWLEMAKQHGIDPTNGQALHRVPGGNWPAFFRRIPQREGPERYVPRAAFVDLDAETVEQIAQQWNNFFHSGCFFVSHEGVDNSYAGPEHLEAQRLTSECLRFVGNQNSDTGSPTGVLLIHSLEGGTGSGLGGHLMRAISELWPMSSLFCLAPTPQRQVSHLVVSPYNALLGIRDILRHADGVLFLDSESSGNATVRYWGREATGYEELNRLQATMLAGFLAPVRFPQPDAPCMPLPEWLDALNIGSSKPWMGVPRLIPLQKCAPRGQRGEATVAAISEGCLKLLGTDLPEGGTLTMLLQGRQGERTGGRMPRRLQASMRLRPRTEVTTRDTILCLGDFGDMRLALSFVLEQAAKLLKRRAYLQNFEAHGVNLVDMQEALLVVNAMLGARHDGQHQVQPELDLVLV